LRLGIHTFTSGSLEKAALRAGELGAQTFQIFSASPRMWRARTPDPKQVALLRAAREQFNLHPLAIHASYLINLASADPLIRTKSIGGFRGELQRAAVIGAEYLVIHPGSYRGQSVEEAVAGFATGLRDASRGLRLNGLRVLLENTAGSGCQLGGKLEELSSIRELTLDLTELSVGYCLDTCHLFAAGFDISCAAGLRLAVGAIEKTLGFSNVYLIHANDSKGALGSRVDRHTHIGAGHIGVNGFGRILRHRAFRAIPFILETPVERQGDDRRNLDTLRSLAASRRTTAPRLIKPR
jgi:deoxyribonuclease IV